MAEISPLQLIAQASWGNNTAVAVNSELISAIDAYVDTPLLIPLANKINHHKFGLLYILNEIYGHVSP